MLELKKIHKSYAPNTPVINGIDLSVKTGEIVCLLGPSGCGKTTVLRIVAGLEQPDTGVVYFQGRDLAATPVYQRHFGFMFQDFALFPHKTVAQNIGFGLRMARESKAAIARRVDEMLALVNLSGYGNRTIFELSGGERQRVALARSLAPNPRLLMLDEPLGSLDRTLREGLMSELRLILKRVGVTALYVTHDQEEAFAIADQLVLMHKGRVEQIGAPAAVYAQPATAFAARFLGFDNLLPATVAAESPQQAQTSIGSFALSQTWPPGSYTLLIRPDAARIVPSAEPQNEEQLLIQGELQASSFRGRYFQILVKVSAEGQVLKFDVPADAWPELADWTSGQRMMLYIDPQKVRLLQKRLSLSKEMAAFA
ncbi:MAG: ABC transporter ATP-binding protein [Caldilineaceae bacterium]